MRKAWYDTNLQLKRGDNLDAKLPSKICPLFMNVDQRHLVFMLMDFIRDFFLELLKTTLVEGLFEHGKRQLLRRLEKRRRLRHRRFYTWLRTRHGRRLVHRLVTGDEPKF